MRIRFIKTRLSINLFMIPQRALRMMALEPRWREPLSHLAV
jgi:hypothetical protein